MNVFKNKTVLITGGTGFIGKALTKAILKQNPKAVRLFSRDEVKHYKAQEFFDYDKRIRNFVGDVRDYNRLEKACRDADIVIHAAALKRIDLIEYNVDEAIKTNILGTLNLVRACLANRVDKAVLISTDKACSPVNTYGACKFVGERIFTATNYSKGDIKTIFTTVRYGNVLESTGSVIPCFKEKIKNGEKIPLTDKRMTRFIISSKQAVDLISKAIELAEGGEVFVPVCCSFKITDLIKVLKEEYKKNNKIKLVGIRPGEKINELLINESEIQRTIKYKNLYIVLSSIVRKKRERKLLYIREGKKIKEFKEYNSKNHLLDKKELKKNFKKLGII